MPMFTGVVIVVSNSPVILSSPDLIPYQTEYRELVALEV